MSCYAETEIGEDLLIACGSCGSRDVRIVGGEEFLLTTMDLKEVQEERSHG